MSARRWSFYTLEVGESYELSSTPRTEAAAVWGAVPFNQSALVVSYDIAAQLERELSEALLELSKLRGAASTCLSQRPTSGQMRFTLEQIAGMGEEIMKNLMLARLRRWWYLLTSGMWRGECSMDMYIQDGHNGPRKLTALASCNSDNSNIRYWWKQS